MSSVYSDYSLVGKNGIFRRFSLFLKRVRGVGCRLKFFLEGKNDSKNNGGNQKSLSQLEIFLILGFIKYLLHQKIDKRAGKTEKYKNK